MWKLISEGGIPDLVPMERTVGPHVSEAIRKMSIRRGDYKDEGEAGFLKPIVRNRMELGNAFEHGLVERFAESGQYEKGREIELDGIYGTPDLISQVDEIVPDIKVTWMGAKRDIHDPKLLKYKEQVMAYAHMLGYRRARLKIVYVNGFYRYMSRYATKEEKDNDGPLYRVYEGEFSKNELAINWAQIRYELKDWKE